MKHGKFLHGAILAFAFILGIEAGAAIFVTAVVFPMWASSPDAATGWLPTNTYYIEEGDVFMFTSSASILITLIILIAGWKADPVLRKWIRIAAVIFIIVFVWSAVYFIPIQDSSFKGEAGLKMEKDKLASGLKMFVNLNYIRLIMVIITFAISLHLVGLSYRLRYLAQSRNS